jgi:hypothetical protein
LDIQRGQGDTTLASLLVHRFADRFRTTQWPHDRPLPEVYYDPRSLEMSTHEKSAMHAKCIAVDGRDLFVSSANFTEAAQNRNLEVGLLIRSVSLAENLVRHFDALVEQRLLLPAWWPTTNRAICGGFMRDSNLEAAYRNTNFWVEDAPGGSFCIRVGTLCPELDRILADLGVSDWAYITAYNPGSELVGEEENTQRMLMLEKQLRGLTYVIFHGKGVAPMGGWPSEPSLLVLGIVAAQAREIGAAVGQKAIVVGRHGQAAQLAWMEDEEDNR